MFHQAAIGIFGGVGLAIGGLIAVLYKKFKPKASGADQKEENSGKKPKYSKVPQKEPSKKEPTTVPKQMTRDSSKRSLSTHSVNSIKSNGQDK